MTTLGKYELHEQLGKGGFGAVYRAVDNIGRAVAVKVLKPGFADDPEAIDRFRREALAAGSLFHPHIATILEFDESDGRLFIVMRYIEGQALDKVLKERGRLPWEEAVKIIRDIAGALEFAHGKNFIHRDIKPGNIIVSPSDGAVLTDFGLVKAVTASGLSTSGVMLGTPAYIAPEVWSGQAVSPATDIYSLACVFYEMITGEVLFDGESSPEIMKKHFDELKLPETWPEGTLRGVSAVLEKALAREPGQRYSSAGAFAAAIEGCTRTVSTKEKTYFKPKEKPSAVAGPLKLKVPGREEGSKTWPWKKIGIISGAAATLGLVVWLAMQTVEKVEAPSPADVANEVTTVMPRESEVIPTANPTLTSIPPTMEPTQSLTPEPTAVPILGIGSTQISEADGMEMLYVPAGEFKMGSNNSFENERPIHPVFLSSFWIDKYEVTNQQYQKCADAGICWASPCLDGQFSGENQPVVCVSWEDSKDYCEWVGRRLPTEAEWEKAARGTDERIYPWGNADPGSSYANWEVSKDGFDFLAPVGSFPSGTSPFGVMDMAGNVWEWTADIYGPYSSARVENPTGAATGMFHVLRGGSWNTSDPQHLRTTVRLWESMNLFNAGFRCAMSD